MRAGEGYTLQSNCVDGANVWVPERLRLDGEWAVDEWVQYSGAAAEFVAAMRLVNRGMRPCMCRWTE